MVESEKKSPTKQTQVEYFIQQLVHDEKTKIRGTLRQTPEKHVVNMISGWKLNCKRNCWALLWVSHS